MAEEEAIKVLREIQDRCRYCTYIQNGEREEWKREYQAIETILKIVESKTENKIRLIDLANCKIVYEYTDNDGYYWSGIIVLKYGEKYCVVEYKGSGSGYIENQIESVDKEFLSNAITTNLYSSTYKGNFGKFLEETYGEFSFYSLEVGRIGRQLVEQNAILLDYKDIKDYIVRRNKNGIN